ncbi:MAG: T9SS type A sorting domain-containing protein [Chitinophagales bacterium]
MNKLLLIIFLVLAIDASAQYQSSNWYFGEFAGITFSTNPPTPLTGGQINQQEGCASISDAAGNLLFYSDGQTIWDNTNSVMPNGTGLLGGGSSTQSCIVVQDPGDSTKYYLITAPQEASGNPMAYSIIDMTLNGGHGDVTSTKNVTMLTNATEKLTAVYNSNGHDVWILAHEFGNNNFDAFLLTDAGISSTPLISSVGSVHDNSNESNVIGYMKASPCANKLAVALWFADYLELFDFDNSTGIVSHPVMLGSWSGSATSGVYGVEFSPDDSKLYASVITPGIVVQYDLNAGSDSAIIQSALQVGSSPVNFNGALQTGPDARMYLVKYGSGTLDCITNPNNAGLACNYLQDFISLGSGIGQLGLPDFFSSFFCRIVGVPQVGGENSISVFPNPASDDIHITLNNSSISNGYSLKIFNELGQCVYSSEMKSGESANDFALSLEGWSKGIYFLDVKSGEKSFAEKFVKN